MKIGLIRHFKVKQPFPKKLFLTKSEVINWFEEYEVAELEYQKIDLQSIEWKICYSSSLNRAVKTANYIYDGKIILVKDLEELNILHLLPNKLKLPFLIWAVLVRVKSLSNNSDVRLFREKIIEFLSQVLKENKNVLIISHWFVMKILEDELNKQKINGEKIKSPKYGKIYIFENSNDR